MDHLPIQSQKSSRTRVEKKTGENRSTYYTDIVVRSTYYTDIVVFKLLMTIPKAPQLTIRKRNVIVRRERHGVNVWETKAGPILQVDTEQE